MKKKEKVTQTSKESNLTTIEPSQSQHEPAETSRAAITTEGHHTFTLPDLANNLTLFKSSQNAPYIDPYTNNQDIEVIYTDPINNNIVCVGCVRSAHEQLPEYPLSIVTDTIPGKAYEFLIKSLNTNRNTIAYIVSPLYYETFYIVYFDVLENRSMDDYKELEDLICEVEKTIKDGTLSPAHSYHVFKNRKMYYLNFNE